MRSFYQLKEIGRILESWKMTLIIIKEYVAFISHHFFKISNLILIAHQHTPRTSIPLALAKIQQERRERCLDFDHAPCAHVEIQQGHGECMLDFDHASLDCAHSIQIEIQQRHGEYNLEVDHAK